jgi:hypothetical protein
MSDIGVYVVAAAKGGETRYWAAAVPQHRAVDEVARQLANGWHLTLTDRHLTPEQIAELKIRSNTVQELHFIPWMQAASTHQTFVWWSLAFCVHSLIWNFGPISRTNLNFNTAGNARDRAISPPVLYPISDNRRRRFETPDCRARKEQNFSPVSRRPDIPGLPQPAHCVVGHCASSDVLVRVGNAGLSSGPHQWPLFIW